MNINSNQIIILSAELKENRYEKNRQFTENLANCLDDCNFNYKRGEGRYKNNDESIFIVKVSKELEIETLKDFAFKSFNQESILHIDSNNESYLYYGNGNTEQLGRLEQVSKSEALHYDNYTILNNKYYVSRKRGI